MTELVPGQRAWHCRARPSEQGRVYVVVLVAGRLALCSHRRRGRRLGVVALPVEELAALGPPATGVGGSKTSAALRP